MRVNFYKAGNRFFTGVFKSLNANKKEVFLFVFFALIFSIKAFSATITTAGSGNWSSTVPNAPWPGGIIPSPGDDIIIQDGTTLTVDGNVTCRSIAFGAHSTHASGGIVVNTGFTLTVTTDILCPIATADIKVSATYTLSGGGTINCANLVTNNALKPTSSNTTTVTVVSTVGAINISNNLLINSTVNQGAKTNNGVFNLRSGTVTVSNAVTTVSVANENRPVLDMATSAAGPTLNLPNPDPWDLSNKGVNVTSLNGTGATVNYNGTVTQNFVLGTTYNNLTLSGSGVKKLQAGVTVAGTLSMQGIATTANQTPTYLTGSTLEYKGSAAQTTGKVEYPATGGPPNLRIDNSLGVTLDENKSVPGTLTFVDGKLITGINKISIGVAGTVTGAGPGKYIYGNEEIFVANTLNPSETFHIGDATTYAPATVAFLGTTTGSGSLTASTSGGDHADINNSGINRDTSVNRNWTISRNGIGGFLTYDATFNYVASDIDPGANPADFAIRKLSGVWGATNTMAANPLSTQAGGMTSFGTYQIGKINTLEIDTEPASHPACLGYSTTFSLTSPSIPAPSVKWQRADITGIFTDIGATTDGGVYSGFTSTTLVISNVTVGLNNYIYRAILTNINGTVTSAAATLTTTVPPSATISYAGTPFCTTLTTDQPVSQTGTAGGTYSSAPGLTIDGVTGNITPSTSSAGTYTVTYTIAAAGGCPTYTTTTTITITAAPSAAIYYAGSPFCTSLTTAQPVTRNGATGGTYSSTTGLSINASTGAVTPSLSTPGTYTVTYTVPAANGCAEYSTTTTVTITQAPSATITYPGTPYCNSITAAQPVTRTGTMSGIFSSSPGLAIDPTTGSVVPSESSAGTYTVTYTVAANAGCAAYTATTSVTITAMPSATISYAGTPFCTSITTAQSVARTGTTGGTYSAEAGLSIDPNTGAITPSTSAAGVYTVTYAVNASGGCALYTTTTSVTITAASATIFYQESPFCSSEPTPQTVTLTGNTGGTFSSTAGLVIDASTGEIIPASSTPGTYTVTYSVAAAGGCAAITATTSITVTAAPYAIISYTAPAFCKTVTTNQVVTRTGNASGTYSSTPGLSISASTGAIRPSTSTAGTYTVTYTVPASGGCDEFYASTTVTITDPPSATISYTGTPFCSSITTARTVTRTGTAGGTYSAAAGLSIDPATGTIVPSASTPGTYTVTYSIAASGGCAAFFTTTSVTVTQAPSAAISYAGTPFCTSITTAQAVTRAGTSGGTYSSTAGLTISSSTGEITPSTSTPGTYIVTYSIAASGGCAAFSTTASVTITAASSATISYTGSPFCTSVTSAQAVTRTGTAGGTFSSTAGLSIDAATGAITPSASTPGTYTVTYSIAAGGGCAAFSTTRSVTITLAPSATISYAGTPFCTSTTTAQNVTRTGTAGGTYSAGVGLIINASTGAITPSTSTAGTYTVTYTIAASGGCAAFSTNTSVTITAAPSASISYAGAPFCTSVTTAQPVTRTGTAGGTYSSTAGLSIDATTGAITPSASTPGVYTVTYTIAASGGCASYSTTRSVTITQAPSATISYPGTPFCTSVTSAQAVTRTGTAGGTYSSTTGLSLNASTGAITPSASTQGTYTVTYTIAASGGCAAITATATVSITTGTSATITYAGSPFCTSVTTAQAVTRSGTAGGTYSSTTGLSVNASTGAITPSASTPGTYTVNYAVPASGGCGAYTTTATVTITAARSATISYTGTPFCTSVTTAQAVTTTGSSGGTYSSTAGLSINTSTGAITPSLSTAGVYTVTYTIAASGGCAAFSTTTSVTITAASSATISYSSSVFCTITATAQPVTRTGTAGGTYSSTTGLSLNATTGAITPSTSIPGTYTVTYSIAASGSCPAFSTTTTVTIATAPSATISYSGSPFCTSITAAQPVTRNGASGGTYSSAAGLSINASTGAITPSASAAGTYTVTYTIAASGGCAAFLTTTSVTIAGGYATISYAGNPFCTSVTTAQAVTRTGTTGGTYSSSAGLTLNTSTGAITPSTSTAGTYTVSYTVPASGGCPPYIATASVIITKAPTATISYASAPFCTSEGDQLVTQTGTAGGVYSAPAGVSINSSTGTINAFLSTAGSYTVTYTIAAAGGCAAFSTTASVTITQGKTATISYAGQPFCESDNQSKSVTLTGATGGVFSSDVNLFIDAGTGAVRLNKSVRGEHTVTYTIAATGGCPAFTTTTPFNIDQPAVMSISYPGTDLCTLTTTPQPVNQTGITGGTYSATGLAVNASSGAITPYPSPAGTYTVAYEVTNGCGTYTATTPVTIRSNPSAAISYSGSPYCGALTTSQPVTQTGTAGGTYTATPGLTINATTGAISPFESTAGTYTVTYTVTNGGCTYAATTSVTIYSISLVTIAYDATAFCKSDNTERAVTQSGGSGGGSFSAPPGLVINTSTGSILPSASTAGTYTVSYNVPASGGCPSYFATTDVTITAIPNATMAYTGSPYCSNGDTASVSLSGTPGGIFSSSAGLSINAATGNVTLGTSIPGTYTVNYYVPAAGGCQDFSTSAPFAINIHAIWNGSVSRNWHNPANWSCGGLPTLTSNAVIPSGLTNYPIIYSGIATTDNITIETGASIIDSGALTIAGTIYNSGYIDATAGKVELAGSSAQVIPSSLFYSKTVDDLVISSPAGVTLKGPLRVTGSLAFGNVNNSVFNTGDSLTLASVSTRDAQVKDITNGNINSGNTINGLVIVERYMPAKRAYRFLTAPVNSTGSIRKNWMENSLNPHSYAWINPYPGYGTNITGAGDNANGFDPTQTRNPSMFTFNNQTQGWVPIPNTNSLMSVGNAWRIIVRGDRSINMNSNTASPTPTTLRATGQLVTGNVTLTKFGAGGPSGFAQLSPITNTYNLVANPYASAIDWLTVDKTDLATSHYVFDPNIPGNAGRGGYVTFNTSYFNPATGRMGVSSNPSSAVDNYIQSGQAFLVLTAGPNPTIRFKETDKASQHRSVFRGSGIAAACLSVQLQLQTQEGSTKAADGLRVYFGEDYSNSIGTEDSYKLSNQDENIAVARDKSLLSIEGRQPVVVADTVPIKIWQLTQSNYILKVNFDNFTDNVEAFLEDKYLRLTSPLSTHDETKVPISVTSDPASSAPDRFKIVFEAYATLPLHLLGVKGVEKNNGVDVGWIAESESNMEKYEVQKSADGQQFVTAGTVKAKANPGASSSYNWFDLIPFDGDNYYRIKSVDKAGGVKYSSITKVRIKKGITGIAVFPNPVRGKTITMHFSNIKQGNYAIQVINASGEKVYQGAVSHSRGSSNHSINLSKVLPAGVYQLVISNSGDVQNIRLLIE